MALKHFDYYSLDLGVMVLEFNELVVYYGGDEALAFEGAGGEVIARVGDSTPQMERQLDYVDIGGNTRSRMAVNKFDVALDDLLLQSLMRIGLKGGTKPTEVEVINGNV